ncbi:murein transglycosylase A [Sphingomicrobium sediminis]|uniref:peptidoglycan lytic exotransglycosylase n=1 Tax=Sphingomicrobium sediminis TaxID=2950949 RepID=A0A9X2EFL0_9SPHN|nr:MltA domain-containing protein [Sphingomicrobium sediminis]MCM8557070.1 MltA domain-containing protein [Sphingomicrobium sediminis]
MSLRAAWPLAALLLAGCATSGPSGSPDSAVAMPPERPGETTLDRVDEPAPPRPEPVIELPEPTNGLEAGLRAAAVAPLTQEEAQRALAAFIRSCPKLLARDDASGLTIAADWAPLCNSAERIDPSQAVQFFTYSFAWVELGDGDAFATGYFEPEIPASLTRSERYNSPIYRRPDDLQRASFSDGSGAGRGRYNENGEFVRYFDRGEIVDGALEGRGLEIAYAADPVDLFFLQIQGSGRLRLPDGDIIRIGYADQNGRAYVPIGRLLREREIMAPGTINLDSLSEYLRADPVRGDALMDENPSYIFFRVLEGEGPLGALEVPVVPLGSVAADPAFMPLGAPVWLDMEDDAADGLWVAQDTGGAIKGANRFDTFWGAGPAAKRIAGLMQSPGRARLLVPKSAAARLGAAGNVLAE